MILTYQAYLFYNSAIYFECFVVYRNDLAKLS